MRSMVENEIDMEIDEVKKRKIRKTILDLERDNVNTKRYNEKEIVKKITSIIEEEVTSRY